MNLKSTIFRTGLLILFAVLAVSNATADDAPLSLAQGLLAGEPTDNSIILQARLTSGGRQENGEITGAPGFARFEVSRDPEFSSFGSTDWLAAEADRDFTVKQFVDGLQPATLYYYRLRFGKDREQTVVSEAARFETLAGAMISRPVTFTALTCLNYVKFHFGDFNKEGELRQPPYPGLDKHLGYTSFSFIPFLQSQFVIYNGDNVYYDQNVPGAPHATKLEQMRYRWHRQFSQPRVLEVLNGSAGYWLKDDHDFRYNDSDMEGDREPSPETGIRIFREQAPVVDPADKNAVTYRSRRISKELELWFLEGRDYRSPNAMPDGPGKSIWGAEQMAWLKRTLLKSDARFKLLIVPSPLVGPDKASKSDNHTNLGGFRHEAAEFFAWLTENSFSPEELMIVTGDRHWQYHSIHPSGFQEFSAGSISFANAQRVMKPGDVKGTDPESKIRQPFASQTKHGGFLQIDVNPGDGEASRDEFKIRFYDEWGQLLYSYVSER